MKRQFHLQLIATSRECKHLTVINPFTSVFFMPQTHQLDGDWRALRCQSSDRFLRMQVDLLCKCESYFLPAAENTNPTEPDLSLS